ncbi:tight adherence pilus pseudopilin TadF [Vibrio caribbeanicus]|uniref:tight adherence pilus pseudopilin TadF n=1 Tax=Vibrio caribbeanicus TaxID=701175 RepID=UPI0030DDCAC9
MKRKQNGSFLIELMLFIIFIIGILILMINHMIALNYKGQLDRLAYSASTILAERKQLFDGDIDISSREKNTASSLYTLVASSMTKMNKNFDKQNLSVKVEMIELKKPSGKLSNTSFELQSYSVYAPSAKRHDFPNDFKLSKEEVLNLLPMTNRGRYLPLYRVSLSYQIPYDLLGSLNGESHRIISSSFSFGRI